MATYGDLISRTITRLSMVPGYGVQTYAEDQIGEMIRHKFLMARDMLWWDDMMLYAEVTIDSDGLPTDNIVRELPDVPAGTEIVINKYSDIQHIWDSDRDRPLPAIPRRQNPNSTRTYYKMRGPDATKVFKIYNANAGDTFTVRYRQYYPAFVAQDTVPFDEQALILGAAWDYLEDDGSNPGQIEKFFNLYTQRMDQLAKAENDEDILVGAL